MMHAHSLSIRPLAVPGIGFVQSAPAGGNVIDFAAFRRGAGALGFGVRESGRRDARFALRESGKPEARPRSAVDARFFERLVICASMLRCEEYHER